MSQNSQSSQFLTPSNLLLTESLTQSPSQQGVNLIKAEGISLQAPMPVSIIDEDIVKNASTTLKESKEETVILYLSHDPILPHIEDSVEQVVISHQEEEVQTAILSIVESREDL